MDDDVLDSWEDAIDTGELEKRMEQREKEIRIQEEAQKQLQARAIGSSALATQGELGKTDYVPQIKILKRQNGPAQKDVKQQNQKPLKTLAEKEAEYAAARARILGDYSSIPSEEDTKKVILASELVTSKQMDSPQDNGVIDEDYRR